MTPPRNKNLDRMVDLTFRNTNKLFFLLFKNDENDRGRDSYDKYYMSLVEIKDFNALLNNKSFLAQPVKNVNEVYEKLNEMSRNDDVK